MAVLRACVGLAMALLAASARAQTAGSLEASSPSRGRIDLGYAVSSRSLLQSQAGRNVGSDSDLPDQLRLAGWYFPMAHLELGADLRYARYQVSGAGAQAPVEGTGNELRIANAIAGRLELSDGLWLRAGAGYLYDQLPGINFSADGLQLTTLRANGPFVLAAVGYALPSRALEVDAYGRFQPWSWGTWGIPLDSFHQLEAGAHLAFGGVTVGSFFLAAVLGYEFERAEGAGPDSRSFQQTSHHVSLGLRGILTGERQSSSGRPARPGSLRGRVFAAGSHTPLAGARVRVGDAKPVVSDERGAFSVADLAPGMVTIQIEHRGFQAAAVSAEVSSQSEASVEVGLKRQGPAPGRLRGKLSVAVGKGEPRRPAAGIALLVGGVPAATSSEDGSFLIAALGPGPVALSVRAPGFEPLEEMVAIPSEAEATVDLLLRPTGAIQLALLKGTVRSALGMPLKARLRVPEANVSTLLTNADGSFSLNIPGGRYTVIIEASGYLEQTRTVEVAGGDQAIFNVDMSPGK